ncbi:lipopolysaccharide biosynthesis protein [Piscinibacter sp.]|uniref:lipopolysaccharide biosynthesis protein n=1 Tax=Piscinibacter sp. TaxID=1903157 RepID=UPI0039E64719
MSPLKINLLANYISQIYVALIGIVMVPVLLSYMGAEAYGLVGFFAMLQGWFVVLDLGFSAALSREAARRKGLASEMADLRHLLRVVEKLFLVVSAAGAVLALVGAPVVAQRWLRVEHLASADVRSALILMTLAALLRWVSGLYRGVIAGLERQVWLGAFNCLIVTLRFVVVILFFMWVGVGPVAFFAYQLGVAAFELLVVGGYAYRLLPTERPDAATGERLPESFREFALFAISMASTSIVWAFATQVDKVLLSSMLPLSEYGYFSVAVLVAGAVLMMTGPLGMAVLPRMSRLVREGDIEALVVLYRNATQLTTVASVPVVLTLSLFPEQLLWAWTGDQATVSQAAQVMALYAAGYGFLVLAALPYFIQHAKGDLRLHLTGTVLFVIVLAPLLWVAVARNGMAGAGLAWLVVNMLFFFAWVPLAHQRFLPGVHTTWLLRDIASIVLPTLLCALLLSALLPWPEQRATVALQIVGVTLLLLSCATICSRQGRALLTQLMRRS